MPKPNEYSLVGEFSLIAFGAIGGSGRVSTGRANGKFSGGGLVLGGYDLYGQSKLLFPARKKSCSCD